MKKINFVNNDAPYLNAENLNQMQDNIEEAIGDTYSTKETFTGKYWIDGKKIYRKVIDIGTLPNAAYKEVEHGISDLDLAIDIRLIGKTLTGARFTGNLTGTSGVYDNRTIVTRINSTHVQFASNIDSSNHSGYVILEYTKTTE